MEFVVFAQNFMPFLGLEWIQFGSCLLSGPYCSRSGPEHTWMNTKIKPRQKLRLGAQSMQQAMNFLDRSGSH